MANEFVGIDIAGTKAIIDKLDGLDDAVADAGVERSDTYILEFERIYPGSMRGAPFKWTSEKQRRAFFATNGFGRGIPTTRTEQLRWGWKKLGTGRNQIVVNEVPYVRFVKEKRFQQIGLRLRGWTTIEEDLTEREPQIVEAFDKGVKQALKDKGLT